ncbi:hypothetical protein ACHAXA_006450 [Cyclostephanos tholiformis]|uniref:Uncharacterized protein n=1 Tax=Cyclostephanos tholiformis TaxID=382380 RepID=A0ABD3SFG6_9STRA
MATSFSGLYNDASKDPFCVNGSYNDYLAPFNINAAGGVHDTPETVRNRLAAAANQRLPVALALLVEGRLRPYFLPFRREQAMGAPPHPATDGKLFAYDGELVSGQGPLAEIPNSCFNLSPVVVAPTTASIATQLAADPHLQLVGPYAVGNADTVELRSRNVIAIPNKYVGLFLSQPNGIVEPTPPGRHVPLLTQAVEMLHHHLPALAARGGQPFDLQPLVNTIVAGQHQRQADQAQARADKLQKETVEAWLGPENFQRLLKYCGVATEADLAPLWPALAKANSKDRLGILQGKVANEFLAMGATYEKYTPNLYLLTELISLRWPMLNPDALNSGALGNAFLFTDSDVESEQNISRQIGIISSGGAAPSLADAQQLLKMKLNLPGPDDSIRAVRRLHAVCRAVLPVAHPLTSFLGQHYAAMRSFDPGWQTYATPVAEYPTATIASTVASTISSLSGSTVQPTATPNASAGAASGNASRAGGSGSRVENTHFNEALFGTYRTSSVKSKALRLKVERGELIARDVRLLQRLGWRGLIAHRRPTGDFSALDNVHHPARRLLQHYKLHGAPVKFSTAPWSQTQVMRALARGPHKSCQDHLSFLQDEFVNMIHKGQWIVLPYSAVRDLPGLRVSPPGVVPQRERRPRWICDYSWSQVNEDTLPLAAVEAMQFGHALDRILREILLADPAQGPIYLLKLDISDGFYRIGLAVDDIPKLGVAFPALPHQETLIAFPLVLPMGWKNSPPIFSTATETIADLANTRLVAGATAQPHPLDDLAESIQSLAPLPPTCPSHVPSIPRDPALPRLGERLSYIDVFVDDFVGIAQDAPDSSSNRRRVRRILLHAVDDVFRPLKPNDSPTRQEPVSLSKLRKGDCSWSTMKSVLGWIINTSTLTIHLPSHRAARLAEILASIPRTQRRTSITKWHTVLGELRSMSLALPGSRNIFSTMQNALTSRTKGRVALHKGVHDALDDFRWLHRHISTRPTRIAELVPLQPVAEGHHDASATGAGGIWFPSPSLTPRTGYTNTSPLAWRFRWPQDVVNKIVTDANPQGSITNSDLELAGGLLHLDALAHCFDIRERTVLSKGDNLSTTFWERKGSTTTNSPPAYLLPHWMSTLDADTASRFSSDIRVAQDTVLQGVSPGRAAGIATAWGKWIEFTHDLGLDPFLQTFQDKIPFLQVFAQRVHSGDLAANGNPIRSRSVEDYIRGVAQTFLHVGATDPHLNTAHTIDFRLQRTLKAWKTTDPAPLRVKPIPIAVIKRIAVSAPLEQICQARFASLTFTTQKNGVRGEVIGLACSGDPFLCPVKALVRRVLYLRQHAAAPDTPIARVFNSVQSVTSSTITSCIREAVAFLGPDLGFLPSDVSARCLRAAGAMALLLAQVDPDVIRLIGRWRSDEMLRYLHVQAYPLMRDYARRMLSSADYTLIPNHLITEHILNPLPMQRVTDLVAKRRGIITRGRSTYEAMFFTSASFPDVELHAAKRYTVVDAKGHPDRLWTTVLYEDDTEATPADPNPEQEIDPAIFRATDNIEDIARVRAKGFEVDDDNETLPENRPALDAPPIEVSVDGLLRGQRWGWDGVDERSNKGGYEKPSFENGWMPCGKTYLDIFPRFLPFVWIENVLMQKTSDALEKHNSHPLTIEFDTWDATAVKTYPALKTFFHEAYGRRLTAIELRSTTGQNGYTNNTIYNAFEIDDDSDDETVMTVPPITPVAASAVSTMASTVHSSMPASVSADIAAAINQLSANQSAIMTQMAALSFAPAPAAIDRVGDEDAVVVAGAVPPLLTT